MSLSARVFGRFAVVGATGLPVTLGANHLLHAWLGLPTALSTALSVEAAICTNFLGNEWWAFRGPARASRTPIVRRFLKFNAACSIGLVVTTAVTTLGASVVGEGELALANLIGIGAGMAWNFLASSRWTWS